MSIKIFTDKNSKISRISLSARLLCEFYVSLPTYIGEHRKSTLTTIWLDILPQVWIKHPQYLGQQWSRKSVNFFHNFHMYLFNVSCKCGKYAKFWQNDFFQGKNFCSKTFYFAKLDTETTHKLMILNKVFLWCKPIFMIFDELK